MKKLLFILSLALLWANTAAAQWTVKTVPNTRLQGNEIHVSDPDGYLSDSTESVINTALCAIREQADVFVVTLHSIGEVEPKRFATSLFNHWGIGDADTDNGVLLLFVEDQRALEFETGYGAEETLTDAQCERIFRNAIVPYFRAGDYEGGLCAGVSEIVTVFGGEVPQGLMTNFKTTADETGTASDDSEDAMTALGAWFMLLFLLPIPFVSGVRWLVGAVGKLGKNKKKEEPEAEALDVREKNGIAFFDSVKSDWHPEVWDNKGFLRLLLYGGTLLGFYALAVKYVPNAFPDADLATQDNRIVLLTLFAYLSLACLVQNLLLLRKADAKAKQSKTPKAIYKSAKNDFHSLLMRIMAPWLGVVFSHLLKKRINRSTPYYCPTCNQPLENDGHCQLPKNQVFENTIGAYRFHPYHCASGHRFVEREEGPSYKKFVNCSVCGAHAAKKTSEKTVEEADYEHTGLKEITYTCLCCNVENVKTKVIPKYVHRTRDDDSYSSSRSSSSSSSSSSGSFGGGSSGGGGYSGRW